MTMAWELMSVAEVKDLAVPDGWHYADAAMASRLVASVRRYGQLRPVVVGRTSKPGEDLARAVVDGRALLAACLEAGLTEVLVVDIGPVDDSAATDAMLALACGFETDYAKLAFAVSARLEAGASADELAMRSPFTTERIGYFGKLAKWDWSLFSAAKGDESPMIDWSLGDAEEAVAVPADTTAAELVREAEAVPPDTPVADVVQHLVEHRRTVRADQLLFEF